MAWGPEGEGHTLEPVPSPLLPSPPPPPPPPRFPALPRRHIEMATKVDQSSSAEPLQIKSAASASSASSPKISIFGAKAGFVIPKNKLAGSLVIRGTAKNESSSALKEESTKQVQRKTKWGPDLTLDPAVRKARASAYQTRVEQITKQLKSGSLETGENEGSLSPAMTSNPDDADDQTEKEPEKLELLELERREIIGEILLLNPGYKAPADYKPLLKETKIPLPTKSHPGYNIIRLLLGPESNTQKQLQEETGAKIRVYGTKKTSGEKTEIRQQDIGEAQDAYEDLYINVSAETYDKVDAAVALIELLLTPVSANSSATSAATTVGSGDGSPAAVQQQVQGAAQPGLLPYIPYHGPWISTSQTNVPPIPSSGPMPNPLPNNSFQLQHPVGASNAPPYAGRPPHMNIMPRTPLPFPGPQSSMPPMQQPPPPYHANRSTGPSFGRPPVAVSPQSVPPSPAGPLPGRPLPTLPASGGWPTLSPAVAQPQRPPQPTPNFMPVRPPISVSPVAAAPRSLLAVPSVSSQSNISTSFGNQHPPVANFTPAAFSSRPPAGPQSFPSVAPPQAPTSATATSPAGTSSQSPHPLSMQVRPPLSMPPSMRGLSSPFPQAGPSPGMPQPPSLLQPTVASSRPPPGVGASSSVGMPGFSIPTSASSIQAPTAALRPPRPVSGDFTFQPLRSPSPTPDLTQPATHMGIQANIPLGLSQPPSFRPANQGFQRPPGPDANLMGPPRMPGLPPHLSGSLFRNPAVHQPPTGAGAFPPTVQPGLPRFSSTMPLPNPSSSLPGRPAHFLPPQQNLLPNMNRPTGVVTPNGPFGESPRGINPIYDPFSPTTAVSVAPRGQLADATTIKKAETDPEYEDLMASVGVK